MKTQQIRPQLKVEKREIRGKKVKKLRKEGFLPANIYGKEIKSTAIKVDKKTIQKFFQQYGETTLIDLLVKEEKSPRPVLMKNPQFDPITDELIHLDFHQVNLKEKVTADIPIEMQGQSPAIEKGEGILVQVLNEIEVEALPTDLPEKFIIDIAKLEKIGDMITVSSLKIDPKKITLHTNPEQVIVQIEAPAKEEVVAPPEEAAAPTEEAVPSPAGETAKTEATEPEEKGEKEE